jgi:hypothetical protein
MSYDQKALAPFVESCRRNVPEAAIVLFAAGLNIETMTWLRASGVEVVLQDFNPPIHATGRRLVADQIWLSICFRITRLLLRCGPNGTERSRRAAEALFSIVTQRFYRYRDYLRNWTGRYSHVLLTDVRDVAFQSSPFPCEGLHVFGEDESIGESHFAKRWFLLSYGLGSWKPYRSHPLLNVGTTLGDTTSVLRYLDQLCSEFDRRLAFFWGADTAMHNYVIHRQLIPSVVHTYGEGSAINLNAAKLDQLNVRNGRLFAPNERLYSIVHQYDRVAGLQLADATNCEATAGAGHGRNTRKT